ncbi:MAG: Fic family protein [Verrucomicrobiota bacterium JB024]|nr:Fic family protein [Verrucomicrobiota bacterium JB024]
MKTEEFAAGTYRQQFQYKSFLPNPINQEWTWDSPEINALLAEANHWLGQLNGLAMIVPDLDLYIRMHVTKEAQSSSSIEGTQTEMDEAVQDDQEVIAVEKRDDWREVRNYIEAMNQSVASLEHLPLSSRLLCQAHSILLKGVRGEAKSPGEFRRSQNWIGGATLADAVFIPPHQDDVPELMSDLEKFWHNEQIFVPDLIRIAISHYQFETIHPFLDGNGRIGRMLIVLFLIAKGLLKTPCLYISAHLEKHRSAYYDSLMAVRTRNDLNQWIRFFLVTIMETSKRGVATFEKIHYLRKEIDEKLHSLGRRAVNARRIVNFLYGKPVFTSAELSKRLKISQPTVDRILNDLISMELVSELTGKQRYRVFYLKEYYQLFLS